MSTRLHALGFPAAWTPTIAAELRTLAAQSRAVEVRRGSYRHWRSRDGAELWFHFPRPRASDPAARAQPGAGGMAQSQSQVAQGDIITPFHRGQSAVKIRIGRVLAMDRSNPLEGSCLAWLPRTDHGGREQPIVFELVPYARHTIEPMPNVVDAQIACFAHVVWAFDTAEAYVAGTPKHRRLKVGAYLPVTQTEVPEVPLSYRNSPVTLGLMTGRVRRSIRFINPVTRAPYYWLSLETKRGLFDVLVNPDAVQGDISEGNIAQAYGSFIARFAGTAV